MSEQTFRFSKLPGRWLHFLAIAGFLLTLAAGILVPVYTDEIGWRFQERAGYDGIDAMINDLCGPNTLVRPPWFMMPVRWFSAIANQSLANPLFIRIEGLICGFGWVGLLCLLIIRLEEDPAKRNYIRTLAFALLGLGTLPYLMVLSRPEQPLILALILTILIVFIRTPAIGARVLAWLKVAGIILLAGLSASYHLKGVAYTPVALGSILVCARGRGTLAPRLAGAAVLGALMLASMQYWVERFQCPGDAKMSALLAKASIASAITGHAQLKDLLPLLVNGAYPLNYVALAAPDNDPMSLWIPANLFPDAIPLAAKAAMIILWFVITNLAIVALIRFLFREKLRGLAEPRALLALAILACVLVWGASQLGLNTYEASHVLPMLVLFVALCLTLPAPVDPWQQRILDWLPWMAVPAALLSEAILLGFTGGPLLAAAHDPGYLRNQPFSVSLTGYAGVGRDIDRAMTIAGMPRNRPLHRLLIDDITYLALQTSHLPLHRLGVLDVWNASISDPAQYLISRHSDGVVMACGNLPRHLEAVAHRSGEICAISPADLKQAAQPVPAMREEGLEAK